MLTMDVFNDSAFSGISLTAALDKFDYVPGYLGSIRGLFTPTPVRTTAIWIEERANAPALIQTSPRGAEPKQKGGGHKQRQGKGGQDESRPPKDAPHPYKGKHIDISL